jgi:hypothetical protein
MDTLNGIGARDGARLKCKYSLESVDVPPYGVNIVNLEFCRRSYQGPAEWLGCCTFFNEPFVRKTTFCGK